MLITIQMKLLPDAVQARLIEETLSVYIGAVNNLVSDFVSIGMLDKRSSANVNAALPSALRCQAIQDARSVFKKYAKDLKAATRANEKKPDEAHKHVKVPVLKKPVAIWNNQNYSIGESTISFPVWKEGKSHKLSFKAIIPERQKALLQNKRGTLRITKKGGKFMAQVAVDVVCESQTGSAVMGVDLGLKVPAVAVTDEGKVKFFGNGRENNPQKRKEPPYLELLSTGTVHLLQGSHGRDQGRLRQPHVHQPDLPCMPREEPRQRQEIPMLLRIQDPQGHPRCDEHHQGTCDRRSWPVSLNCYTHWFRMG